MKKLLPYIRLLLPLKYHLLAGILCGIIYGATSGFGIPMVINGVLPSLFEKDTEFSEKNFKDPSSLAQKLNEQSDAVSGFLWERLYPETRELLVQIPGTEPDSKFEEALLREFNKFIHLENLYDEQRFSEVELSEETLELIPEDSPVEKGLLQSALDRVYSFFEGDSESETPLLRLNRSLLLESYPAELGETVAASNLSIFLAIAWLPLAFLVRAICQFSSTYLVNFCGITVLQDIRLQFFEKLQRLPYSYFSQMRSGDLLSRFNSDTAILQRTIISVTNDLILQPATLLSALFAICFLAIRYHAISFILLSLLVFPLCILPVRYIGKKLLKKARATQNEVGKLSECVTENLATYAEVRAFNLQEIQTQKFYNVANTVLRRTMKAIKYSKVLSPVIEVITISIVALSIAYAAKIGLPYSTVMALIIALYMSYDPVKKLSVVYTQHKVGLASLDRLEETLNEPEEVDGGTIVPDKTKGRIEFSHVSFRYKADPVLKGVSVDVLPGEIVALVGPSGAGKSTFVGLIPRFYDPQEGTISLDGTPLAEIKRTGLRDQIAIVSQSPVLFNTTLKENILIGNRNASMEQVVEAAKKAHAHEFISTFDQGYDTTVGERGNQLSGGQRQRIAIARAFLKNAPILILDEATSALDSDSEQLIQKSLDDLFENKTVFIIAHRFSTIKHATRILVFEEGRIVGDGKHEDLLSHSPLYEKLYRHQFSL